MGHSVHAVLCMIQRHGYDFVHTSTRVYPSSYPGCSHDSGRGSNWQGVVTKISPGVCHKAAVTGDNVHQVNTSTSCELFPCQFD